MTLLDADVWTGKIFSNGWVQGSGPIQDVVEPATGEVLGRIGTANEEDVFTAARRAAEAQISWAAKSSEERAAVLRRAGDLWEKHSETIQTWIIRESGSIAAKASIETHTAANECYEAASLATHPNGEVLTSNEDRWSITRQRPVGVVSVIAPFNFPLILSIRAVAPALALGNAVLIKPDPRTAVCGGVSLVRVLEEAGLPDGLIHLLPGGIDAGTALVEAPEVSVIAFTGSTSAGRDVGRLAAANLKRAHLELGGNNALLVLPDADLEMATSAGAFGSFMHQGQICMSTGRHIVHESVYEEYVSSLAERAARLPVGNPATESVALGPIIDQKQRDRIQSLVNLAVEQGARVVTGGTYESLFYRPTVLADMTKENSAFSEEIFGPVAPVISYRDLDEAVEIINSSDYGLSVGILGNVGEAMRVADRIQSGKVHINEQTVSDEAQAPFGGTGSSGNGSRIGGARANLDAFTETQWLTIRTEIAGYPF